MNGAMGDGRRHPRREVPATLRLHVQLAGAFPPVWRRIELASDVGLDDLHDVLQVVLLPVTMNVSRCSISAMLLLMADEPMASCRPVTLPAWHSRAQWSTLFVPSTARTNFWKT